MKGQVRIDSVFVFTVIDDDGTEGVIAFESTMGMVPMVGADLAMVAKLRPVAQQTAKRLGKRVTLSHYSVRTDQEVYEP